MAKPKNERNTERLVRVALAKAGYFESNERSVVEEQVSTIAYVARMLKTASKSGKGGGGSPEFIVTNPEDPDFLLVVECKASTADHAFRSDYGQLQR